MVAVVGLVVDLFISKLNSVSSPLCVSYNNTAVRAEDDKMTAIIRKIFAFVFAEYLGAKFKLSNLIESHLAISEWTIVNIYFFFSYANGNSNSDKR